MPLPHSAQGRKRGEVLEAVHRSTVYCSGAWPKDVIPVIGVSKVMGPDRVTPSAGGCGEVSPIRQVMVRVIPLSTWPLSKLKVTLSASWPPSPRGFATPKDVKLTTVFATHVPEVKLLEALGGRPVSMDQIPLASTPP